MTVLDLRNFAGEVPKMGPSALQPTQAQRATNCRLVSGEVRPYKQPVQVFETLGDEPKSLYRGSNGAQSVWYTWANDVDVCESPIADTSDYRIYYTGDGAPKKTDWALATVGDGPYPGASWLYMGVPNPVAAPTLAATGSGTGTVVTRSYVYTYLSTFGSLQEESGPSPAATVNWQTGQSIDISGMSAPPSEGYNITGINIYRTIVGTSTVNFELVATIGVSATYTDSILDADVIGTVLQTLTWSPPPENMIGLIDMGYGMLAGFVGNTLYICVPYFPHAWPVEQTLTFPANIVGLGMMSGSLVVCTDQNPFLIAGTAPSNLTQNPISIHEPCVSKRSIVSNLTGMMYASPNGLVGISQLIQGVLTDALIEREAWAEFNPTTMVSAIYDGRYCGFFTLPPGGTTVDGGATDLGGVGFMLDKADEPIRALYTHMDVASFAMAPPLTFLNFYARGVYLDRLTGNLYAISELDFNIYQIDADPVNSMTTSWKSKRFQLASPINMAVIQADANYHDPNVDNYNALYQQVAEANQALFAANDIVGELGEQMYGAYTCGGSALQPLPAIADQQTFQLLVYAGGKLIATYSPQDNEPMRLPGGFREQVWEIEIAANYAVRSVTLASSIKELRDAVMQAQQQPGG